MLRHMLNGHPDILCHGEVIAYKPYFRIFRRLSIQSLEGVYGQRLINDKQYRRALEQMAAIDTDKFLDTVVLATEESYKAVGFKFKTDEYFNKKYQAVARHIKDIKDLSIVHLRRKDLLAQYVSHQLVLNRKTQTVYFGNRVVKKKEAFKVNIKAFLAYADIVLERESRIERELGDRPLLNIWYEDLVKENEKTVEQILTFLNIAYQPLAPTTIKIVEDYTRLIENFEEVIHSLEKTALENRSNLSNNINT